MRFQGIFEGPADGTSVSGTEDKGKRRTTDLTKNWDRLGASLGAQLAKNPPAMRETWVSSLGWEDHLEKGKATRSSTLAWRILWIVYSIGLQTVGHN